MAGAQEGKGGVVTDAPKPTGHSRFGASKAERWMNCTASVLAEDGREDTPSIYAQIGTACHSVSALCLESGQDAEEFVDRTVDGIEIDGDMADDVQLYLNTIRADKAARGGKLFVERRFHLYWLHPEFFGTSDCGRAGTDKILSVYDAKFGRKPVPAKAPQLAYYALGMIEGLPKGLKIDKIELVIIQPNAPQAGDSPPGVRRVLLDHSDLLNLAQELVDAAEEALGPEPVFKPGSWCDFCRAAAVCPSLRHAAMEVAQLEFDDETGVVKDWGARTMNALDMTNAQIAHALDAADLLEAFISAVRVHAGILSNRGEEFPGYKRVDRRTKRKWRDEETAAGELSLVFGLDDSSIYKQKLVSPAQAEKLIGKEERHALEDLYFKPDGGTKLVRMSSEEEAVQSTAQRDFDDDQAAPNATSSDDW